MCRIRFFAVWFVALLPVIWSACAAADPAAEIVSLQGKGEFRVPPESQWRDATLRQKLGEGNFIRTGDSSRMAVLLADQTQLRLAANSMIQLKQVGDNHNRATILNQSAGRSWTQSKNIPNQLTVETPSALAAIRGTDWELVVGDDGSTTLTVLSGEIRLSNDQGAISVGAGEQGQARIGVAPVKRVLQNPRDRVQWVSSFTVDAARYPEIEHPPASLATATRDGLREIAAQLKAGDLAAARLSVERLAAQHPASGTANLLLADFQVMDGDLDAALKTLRDGATAYPDDERFDVARARLQLLRDQPDEARATLASVRAKKPQSAELMIAEGELDRFDGNAAAATAAYQSAIAVAPHEARAWYGMGVVQTEREDVAAAGASLHHALELDPTGVGMRGELGILEAFADRLDDARATFNQALKDHPDDYVALSGLAVVDLKSGHTADAVTKLLAATLIEPRYARAQTWLAVAYYQQGRVHDALFALSRARALDARDPLPDLLESIIHNDLLQPGDALVSARRALQLLPYLKSLNQVADDQKGGANLGNALATFGLEDWARSYAQDSYLPYWAGSHLFLADRYSGDFDKTSELLQGFLADPTVFGASNRFSTLIPRPGNYWNLGIRYDSSQDFKLTEPTITANGYGNDGMPVAYFLEGVRTETRPDKVAFDAAANTYTLGLGARPTYELGLFAYVNSFDADLTLNPLPSVQQKVNGRNERIDLGADYRFGPQSLAWLKIGAGNESSTVNQVTTLATPFGIATNASFFRTRPDEQDIQLRHTFAANEQHEISWGAETARQHKTNTLVQENFFHIGAGVIPSDRLNERDDDNSDALWISDRMSVTPQWLLQADLAWQHYRKTRDIRIYRDRVPPVTQSFPESYDRSLAALRLGTAYSLGNGATLRGAWQHWQRPASPGSLAPVATAGIPIDDSLVYSGGVLTRARAQLDWELTPDWFTTAFADHRNVSNLNSPLDGVLNTRAAVANLDRLRQQSLVNLAAPDELEGDPVFSRGIADSGGITVNHVLSRQLAAYAGYVATHSENTGAFNGKLLPYLPNKRATLGLTWAGDQRLLISAQAVWRSLRYSDEANLAPLASGWDMTLKAHWETADKHWSIDGYAANLFKHDTSNLFGINLIAHY